MIEQEAAVQASVFGVNLQALFPLEPVILHQTALFSSPFNGF